MSEDARFSRWMLEELGIRDAALGKRLSGGNSNITQAVSSASGPMIIRRAPPATISPKAGQGIRREHQILHAIGDKAPVPKALGFCDDPEILGSVFAVTSFVPGVSITTALPAAYDNTPATITTMGNELIDALAAIHNVEWQKLSLETFGRPENFLQRQIERWLKIRADSSIRDLPLIEELGRWLLDNLPGEAASTIVHGDYHLDNTLFHEDRPKLSAVIDWELSTIGDPMTDLGLVLMFWGPRATDSPAFPWVQQVSRLNGAVPRRDLAARWSAATGISSGRLNYYMCFAFWRLAAIVEGAYILHLKGLATSDYARRLEADVPGLLKEAADVISGDR